MDIVCFSHLRWNFVYQRPQHLLSRFARGSRVFFIEEPVFDVASPLLHTIVSKEGVYVLTPHLNDGLTPEKILARQHELLNEYFTLNTRLRNYVAWYYTPLAIDLATALPSPMLTIYDCMDELSAFKDAPPALTAKEAQLLQKADLVFTGGHSLFEAKKHLHESIYPFPSSIDKSHFGQARYLTTTPTDQQEIPGPRIGFFGVVDERFDKDLIGAAAASRPNWHFIIIGPTVKIDPASLPHLSNIHYLGGRTYDELPGYLAGWDVAMIPFAMNESTKFISPTKTPEYLAGGIPVVSTPIRDVVRPYGEMNLVEIATTPEEFISGVEKCLASKNDPGWLPRVDAYLSGLSWDITWQKMQHLVEAQLQKKNLIQNLNEEVYV